MKERPMIFNAEMVRAILDGRKTQTRRIVKGVPSSHNFHGWVMSSTSAKDEGKACWAVGKSPLLNHPIRMRCPFGEVGDRIWVRETWADVNHAGCPAVAYRADSEVRDLNEEDGDEQDPNLEKYWFANWYPDLISGTEGNWTPSIHMPRWASRITLEITGVRVERLASISTGDAQAEGYPAERAENGGNLDAWLWFRDLWDGIYPEQTFKHNPWVWVIEFKRIEGGA